MVQKINTSPMKIRELVIPAT